MPMHPGQRALTIEQVRGLFADQFPGWAGLPVRPVESAWTMSALFRVGDGLVARFPLVGGTADAIRHELEEEAERSAELAVGTSVPAPVPVALGQPGRGYDLRWLRFPFESLVELVETLWESRQARSANVGDYAVLGVCQRLMPPSVA